MDVIKDYWWDRRFRALEFPTHIDGRPIHLLNAFTCISIWLISIGDVNALLFFTSSPWYQYPDDLRYPSSPEVHFSKPFTCAAMAAAGRGMGNLPHFVAYSTWQWLEEAWSWKTVDLINERLQISPAAWELDQKLQWFMWHWLSQHVGCDPILYLSLFNSPRDTFGILW